MSNYNFELIKIEQINIEEFNNFSDKPVFTTIPWINFVSNDANAAPIFVRITDSVGKFIGYFSALTTRKFGIRILGSPFRGWSTCYMGIDTEYKELKLDIYHELIPFLFKRLKCQYIEINDRDISVEMAENAGIKAFPLDTLDLDINKDDAGLFKQMKTDCRNFIRQFERRGARLEIAEPNDEFAELYYKQLEDVFAKQGLVPTYSLQKVKTLMRSMSDSDDLLCLKVISPDERCIATSIFPGYGNKFYFWGGASYRPDQHYRPNEYMIWTAIKYWRDRGCTKFDMVGSRDYKRKFGSYDQQYANMIFAKARCLITGRIAAEKLYFKCIELKGKILKKR